MTYQEKSILNFYVFGVILTSLILACIFPGCDQAFSQPAAVDFIPNTEKKVEQLADAIFWAEGGYKTNFPYGIKSVKCEGYDECRRICKNTIKNNIRRYRKQSNKLANSKSYLDFLAPIDDYSVCIFS